MFRVLEITKDIISWTIKRDRGLERYVVLVSRRLWPWGESKLLILVACLAILDYASTYAFLRFGNNNIYEDGLIARWALQEGGLKGLLLVDILAIVTVFVVAISARFVYIKLGFGGFGRAAFIVMLVPYVVVTMAVVFNNIVLMFL